jgi:lipopolysaccharide export system protein LptC
VHSVRDPVYLAALELRFAAAARHSKLVRILRKAMPAAIAVSLLMIAGISVFNPFRMLANLPIDIGNVVVSGTKITMQSPHMTGFTPDRRPYEVNARTAMQDVTNPNFIELDTLKAKVEMEDKSIVFMDARRGNFRNREQLLDLYEDVLLKSTAYEARLS